MRDTKGLDTSHSSLISHSAPTSTRKKASLAVCRLEADIRRSFVLFRQRVGTHFLQELRERTDLLGKDGPFGCGNPFEVQVSFIRPKECQDFPGILDDLLALNITFQVMAVTNVSTGHHDAVGPCLEGIEQERVIDPPRAHEADETHIGRILHSCNSGEIRSGVCTPVAHKCDDLRFKSLGHDHSSSLSHV